MVATTDIIPKLGILENHRLTKKLVLGIRGENVGRGRQESKLPFPSWESFEINEL